jgi:hypothetical protein
MAERKPKGIVASLLEEGILENHVPMDLVVDAHTIQEVKEKNQLLSGGKKYAVLVTTAHGSTITEEARKLVAAENFRKNTIAKALLIDYLPHRIVAKFYVRVNKPAIPTRLFNNREEAMTWLRSELAKVSQ